MSQVPADPARVAQGILDAGLPPPSGPALPSGVTELGLGGVRDGLVHLGPGAAADAGSPLLVMLHGAGGTARHALDLLGPHLATPGLVVLAPDSRGRTWDVICGGYGPDVAFIGRAIDQVCARRRIDPARVAVGGFSDGASYALSLGLANGGLFGRILAFSPGFAAPPRTEGKPGVFISHGTGDTVLPIDACSRRIVPRLRRAGYQVRYREFVGGHAVPGEMVGDALGWASLR